MSRFLTACPIGCNTELTDTDIILEEGNLKKCPKCNQFISQCTEERYNTSMQEFDQYEATLPKGKNVISAWRLHSKRLHYLTKHLNKKSHEIKLLDVGCSSGAFLLSAKKLGFNSEGIEPAKKAVITAQRLGLNVHAGFLEDTHSSTNTYDAITLFEIIEHLREPIPLLQKCHSLLKKEGLLMISTGNGLSWTAKFMREGWDYMHIDKHGGHVTFYNPKSIRKLAKKAGFNIVTIKTRSVRFMNKSNTHKLLYRLVRIFTEFLNLPSKLCKKGHDMLIILRKSTN